MPEENTTNQSPAAGNLADKFSGLKAALEAGTGSLVMVLVSIGAILAAFNSKAAEVTLRKAIEFLKDAKGLAIETAACAATLTEQIWPLIKWRLRQLGWLTIAGMVAASLLVWREHPVGAAWVMLGVGLVWLIASVTIYVALIPLKLGKATKSWQLALSQPFAIVAVLIISISILILALPASVQTASVCASLLAALLLSLAYSVFWNQGDSKVVFGGAAVIISAIAVFGIAMAALPGTRLWLDAKATQKAMLLGLEAEKAADQYALYKVTTAGKLLNKEDGKPLTDEKGSLEEDQVVKVDISLNRTTNFPGIGICRTVYVFQGTEVKLIGEFPMQGLERVLAPEAEKSAVVAVSCAPTSNPASRASRPGYRDSAVAKEALDLSKTKFSATIKGGEWVDTGLIVYPEDRVTWGPFDDMAAEKLVGDDGNFRLQVSQAIRIINLDGTVGYIPNQDINDVKVRGGAGAYTSFTSFWSNDNSFPMLIYYTGEGEADVTLTVERGVLKTPERRRA